MNSTKKKQPPIGFGRTPTPVEPDPFDEEPDPPEEEAEAENDWPKLPPPLASPVFVTDLERYELLQRYDIRSLVPMSAFEMQLLMVIAGLEKRIRELDPLPD